MYELVAAENPAALGLAFDLNTLLSGGVGAGLAGLAIFLVKLILDRTVPSRSDARANITMVLEGLNNMVKVLQEEKLADAKRLEAKRARIEYLEVAADRDYDKIAELRAEIVDLRGRLAQRDRNIQFLVSQLRALGAEVTGIPLDDIDLEITQPKMPPTEKPDFRPPSEPEETDSSTEKES